MSPDDRRKWEALGQILVNRGVADRRSSLPPVVERAGSVIFALYMPIFNLGQAMKGGIK